MYTALRVVTEAGDLLHEHTDPDTTEVTLLCWVARRVLLPCLVPEDHARFLSLLRDVFGAESQQRHELTSAQFREAVLQVRLTSELKFIDLM